jgi:glutaredoxin
VSFEVPAVASGLTADTAASRVTRLVRENPYVVFGTETCPWCKRAITLIEARTGRRPLFVDISLYPQWAPPPSMTNFTSVPKVFIDGRLIGGYMDTARHFGVEP